MSRISSRYNFFGDYLRNRYGTRVWKIPLDGGFTCPNRDGTKGRGGCIFCDGDGSGAESTRYNESIHEQMRRAIDGFERSDTTGLYIAYFQSFTGTYAPIDVLKSKYDEALSFPGIQGIMIGTRPDCVPDDVLNLIATYNRPDFELWLELGMQSIHNDSLKVLNRRHDHATTLDAIERAASKDIPVCVHVILGIPGETWHDMMATAETISRLPVSGVKIHHLHIIANTPLDKLYHKGKAPLFTLQEYVSTVTDFMERLRHDIIIHRISGDHQEEGLVAPEWTHLKGTIQRDIEEEFIRRETYQGFLFQERVYE